MFYQMYIYDKTKMYFIYNYIFDPNEIVLDPNEIYGV